MLIYSVSDRLERYHQHLLIEKAKDMLTTTDLQVSEIAYALGFGDALFPGSGTVLRFYKSSRYAGRLKRKKHLLLYD